MKRIQSTYCFLVLYYVEWETWYITGFSYIRMHALFMSEMCVDALLSICISVIELAYCNQIFTWHVGANDSVSNTLQLYHVTETSNA